MKTTLEVIRDIKQIIIHSRQQIDDEIALLVLDQVLDNLDLLQKEIDREPSSQTHLTY